jgi:CBS domain-containing protein
MTKENLVTTREEIGMDEAKRLLHQYRIEKLVVVDDAYLDRNAPIVAERLKRATPPFSLPISSAARACGARASIKDRSGVVCGRSE